MNKRLSVELVGLAIALVVLEGGAGVAAPRQAQQPPPPPPTAPQQAPSEGAGPRGANGAGVNQNEVQLWFDAMVIVQAQKALGLTDAQYPQFVGRLKALQDTRRRAVGARNRLIGELNKLTNANVAAIDEAQVRDRLKALDDLRAKSAADIDKAYEALDQVLDLRQQARFRVFEEQVERRKFEFLLNARGRGTRPGNGQ